MKKITIILSTIFLISTATLAEAQTLTKRSANQYYTIISRHLDMTLIKSMKTESSAFGNGYKYFVKYADFYDSGFFKSQVRAFAGDFQDVKLISPMRMMSTKHGRAIWTIYYVESKPNVYFVFIYFTQGKGGVILIVNRGQKV